MARTNPKITGSMFSQILSFEDLISDIQSGTITQNDLVDRLETMHKELCDLLGKVANDPSFKEP